MAKIHTLSIKHFRGIAEFKHMFYPSRFNCLIGRGDSGKSTILEAISIVLSSNWNVQFQDTDFHNCDISVPIEIEVSLYDIPKKLLLEDKYGLHIRGLDTKTNEIIDEIDDQPEILTISLIVEKDLEPKWYVVNGRQEPIEIRAADRAKFNLFYISDYIDRHFNWNYGGPLYSLLNAHSDKKKDKKFNVLVDALRAAKNKIDQEPFDHLAEVTNKVVKSASKLGLAVENATSTIDFRDLFIRDGRISLHADKVPFRLKGKGSKRLLSIAIQLALLEESGVILIDELEQGLEPDRSVHIAQTLKNNKSNQFFVSTHSRDILAQLSASDLCLMRAKAKTLVTFQSTLQGVLRRNPEAFYSNKIIVCEGETEKGILISLDKYREYVEAKRNFSDLGIGLAIGGGNTLVEYCKGFAASGFKVCLFVDSDEKGVNDAKEDLRQIGVDIFDWPNNDSVETAILNDLPNELLKDAVDMAIDLLVEYEQIEQAVADQSIKGSIEGQGVKLLQNSFDDITIETRRAICAAAKKKDGSRELVKLLV